MSRKNKYQAPLINDTDDSFNLKKFLIWIIIIIVVLVGFYFITNYVLDHKSADSETSESIIQTDKIIFGQMFDRKYSEYYVLAYKNDSQSRVIYDRYISKYSKKDDHLNIFMIDMDEAFNQKYVSDKSNIVDNLNELKVSDDTLFKIKDGKISEYKVGSAEISSYLKEISE